MSEGTPDSGRWSYDPAAPAENPTSSAPMPSSGDGSDIDQTLVRRPRNPRPRPAGAARSPRSASTRRPATAEVPGGDQAASSFGAPAPRAAEPYSPAQPAPYRLPAAAVTDPVIDEFPTVPRLAAPAAPAPSLPAPAVMSAENPAPSVFERAKAGVVAATAAATAVAEKVAQSAQSAASSASASEPDPVTGKPRPRVRRTRRARLRISRIDPWSVMKTSLLFGIAGGIIFVVAVYVLMSVVEATGLFAAVNSVVKDVLASPTDPGVFDITTYINTKRATGLAALIGAIDVVIFTALATVFSFLYNLSATMLGGLEITLAED